jgi:predicted nucleic acid-binding protein
MNAEVFIDTNVLLYAISSSRAEAAKARRARRLLDTEDFGLSAQVLSEFFVNATRKIATPLSDLQALEFIEIIAQASVVPFDAGLVTEAIAYKQRLELSYWDAAIVAAAHRLGARTLYTEDLNHGQLYGSVKVLNPFARARPRAPKPT